MFSTPRNLCVAIGYKVFNLLSTKIKEIVVLKGPTKPQFRTKTNLKMVFKQCHTGYRRDSNACHAQRRYNLCMTTMVWVLHKETYIKNMEHEEKPV